jgi:hypothetical protein
MTDALDLSRDLLSDPILVEALRSERWLALSQDLLPRLHRRVMENRTALEHHACEFNKAYQEAAAGNLDADGLVRLAEAVLEAERGAAEQLHPWMEVLRETQAPQSEPAQEARQYLHELHEIAVAWLATYQTLRERLLKLASERRHNSSEVLRARPGTGAIDYAELSREHIARFPKILTALAK